MIVDSSGRPAVFCFLCFWRVTRAKEKDKTIQDSFLEKTGKELLKVFFLINVLHALLCFSWCTWCAHSLAVSYVLSHSLKGHLKWLGLFPSQVLVHLVTSPTTSSTLGVFGFGGVAGCIILSSCGHSFCQYTCAWKVQIHCLCLHFFTFCEVPLCQQSLWCFRWPALLIL